MALTTTQVNNKLIEFRKQVFREYVRENLFSPYMGEDSTAIIRVLSDLDKGGKMGGEQINIPLIARAQAQAISTGNLVGNEEQIDNYGMRMWIDWARNGMAVNNAEENKSSIDLTAQMKPLLSDWGKELHRDEICDALYAVVSQTVPAGLGTFNGQRVNGVLFDTASPTQRNTWIGDNIDRMLVGNSNTANYVSGNFASSMANVTSSMTLSYSIVQRIKRSAKIANPRIRPYKLKENGTEWFVLFTGQEQFRDAANDATILANNQQSRARENQGFLKNPIFVDGDLLVNGVIIREIPELSLRLPAFYQTAGDSSTRIAPCFLCGQQALAWPWGRMPRFTFRKEDDFQFIRSVGIEMAYGVGKIAKLNPTGNFKEWGVYTTFLAATQDQ